MQRRYLQTVGCLIVVLHLHICDGFVLRDRSISDEINELYNKYLHEDNDLNNEVPLLTEESQDQKFWKGLKDILDAEQLFSDEVAQPDFPVQDIHPNFLNLEIPVEDSQPDFPVEVNQPEFPVEDSQPDFPVEVNQSEFPVEGSQPDFPDEVNQPEFPVEVSELEDLVEPRFQSVLVMDYVGFTGVQTSVDSSIDSWDPLPMLEDLLGDAENWEPSVHLEFEPESIEIWGLGSQK